MAQPASDTKPSTWSRRAIVHRLLVDLRVEVQALRRCRPEDAAATDRISEALNRLAQALDEPMERTKTSSSGARHLLVGPNATWFRLDYGQMTTLRRRRALSLILDALAVRPGEPLASAALVAVAWPDAKPAVGEGAAARLRVAIATLRRLGLRDVLVTTSAGYMLDADVERFR